MKYFIALVCLVAGISALPQEDIALNSERIVTGQIVDAINDLSQTIKDAGLDPLNIRREVFAYALPVPVIFNAAAVVEDLLSFGLSDIRIHDMNYSVLLFRLTFDLEIPHIHASVGDAYGEATIFGEKLQGEISGGLDINSIRVRGVVNVRVGVITGISVTNVTINFTLGSVNSYLKIGILSYDISDYVNTFIGATIPNTLQDFSSEINQLIEIVLFEIINDNL